MMDVQAVEPKPTLIVRCFQQLQDYSERFEAMKTLTNARDLNTPDECWILQHHDVLTQGQAGKPEHIIHMTDLPVVQTDRGGQVTWHGQGQLVAYFMFDLNRLHWNVRTLVTFAETIMLDILNKYGITAYTKPDAPGVYVDGRKIGSLGFKIRKGCSYHGLSLNLDCNLDGFHCINPCGYAGLEMVRLVDLLDNPPDFATLCREFIEYFNNTHYFNNVHVSHE